MEERSHKLRSSEPAPLRGRLDQSEARERDLAERYRYIRSHMDVSRAWNRLAEIENAGFQGVLAQLADNGAVLGADAVLSRDLARRHDRFGLTVVLPGHAPLIWLNLHKHDSVADLVDTVVHEAVHSTVRHLGRLPRTPEPDEAVASYGEEVVALAGANVILRTIEFPADRQITQNIVALDNCKEILGRLGSVRSSCARGLLKQNVRRTSSRTSASKSHAPLWTKSDHA